MNVYQLPAKCPPTWHSPFLLMLSLVALGVSGCDSEIAQQPVPSASSVYTIHMLYPPETRPLMLSAIERFNAKNLLISNGSLARVAGTTYDDYAATVPLTTATHQVSLLLGPLPIDTSQYPDKEARRCEPLMSTRLGIAARPIDTFSFPTDRERLSLASIVAPYKEVADPRRDVIVGAPRFSSSGLVAALTTAASAARVPLEQLTAQTITENRASLRSAQERVRNYTIDDRAGLEWLANREGGAPIIAVTTESSFEAHKRSKSPAPLEWVPINTPAVSVDYPLCEPSPRTDTQQRLETTRLARSFFSSEEFKELARAAGFSPTTPTASSSQGAPSGAVRQLLAEWPQIRTPTSTVFVLDTSIKTDLATIETIRREISFFIDARPSKDDSVAIVTTSSQSEVAREPTTDAELLNLTLSRLSTSGGSAVRDGIDAAFNLFEGTYATPSRHSIIVFTSTGDTSSQTTVEQLRNRASQFVGRRNVDLFVLGVGGAEQDFGELPALTKEAGGHFLQTDLSTLPDVFDAIARQVQ